MKIQRYEDWMRPQVVALFDLEYSTGEAKFDALFKAFYEHPFQANECIRIAAIEGDRVAGFQSFFYWPVFLQGKMLRSYQSGNSLVHPDFRGKGLFGKMLNFIHDPANDFDCELLIGFPVQASYNSFIRNQWKNPFNLQWYVKPLNPLRSLLFAPEKRLRNIFGERPMLDFDTDRDVVYVSQTAAFDAYRFAYEDGEFYRYTFKRNGQEVFFEMKFQTRKKYIRELVIGKVLPSIADVKLINEAFVELLGKLSDAGIAMISIAINPLTLPLRQAVESLGFRKIDRSIYFIAKGKVADETTDWSKWWMFRSDIDTW